MAGGGGVPGPGGAPGALGAVPTVVPQSPILRCFRNWNHWVKAELRFVDVVSGAEKGPVAAAECEIKLGAAMVNSGPLSKGALQSKRLPGGTYTVSFPDIDASEWREG